VLPFLLCWHCIPLVAYHGRKTEWFDVLWFLHLSRSTGIQVTQFLRLLSNFAAHVSHKIATHRQNIQAAKKMEVKVKIIETM
jgi:hypothetical protein